MHGLRTPREEIAFTARPKIQSQIFRYGQSKFSDIFDLCLHWLSLVRNSSDLAEVRELAKIWRSLEQFVRIIFC